MSKPRMTKARSFTDIRPGNRVTFWIPAGIGRDGVEYRKKSGRVVMRGPHGWVVNGGGEHGTPYVVNEDNFHSMGTK